MSQQHSIGLAELIEQVRQELLLTGPDLGEVPIFSVDEVSLELQVTVQKEIGGGVKIYVVELGGKMSRDDVHIIKLTLTPLIDKERRRQLYDQHYPGGAAAVERASMATLKGSSRESSARDVRAAGVVKRSDDMKRLELRLSELDNARIHVSGHSYRASILLYPLMRVIDGSRY